MKNFIVYQLRSKYLFYLFIAIFALGSPIRVEASNLVQDSTIITVDSATTSKVFTKKEIRKIKRNAILLAITLGPFGVHRLYLGTNAKVPIAYTLTFGGGLGILVVADIIAIATTKDLNDLLNNEHFILLNK